MSMVRNRAGGYILLETAVALVLLGVGAFAVHGTMREAIRTRGQAQDYTHARYLLTQLVSEIELQPQVTEHSKRGRFSGEHGRFSWEYRVRRVNVPKPRVPFKPAPKGKKRQPFRYSVSYEYLAQVRATVTWERGGHAFRESFETLLSPDKLWLPPKRKR